MCEKIYYSFITRDGYKGNAPKYFEPSEFEWSENIESNWEGVKKELDAFLASGHELWPYFDQSIVTKKNNWKTIPFGAWGVKFYGNRKKAPFTSALLDKVPGVVSASFNMLDAETRIVPHFGDTNAVMRCHLGIVIPGSLPEVGFEVEGEQKSWEEGKLLFFCDAHNHTAWNDSKSFRYILLFDVIRPEYLKKKRWICSKVLASLFLQSSAQKLTFLRKLPLFMQMSLFYMAAFAAFFIVPLRNFVSNLIKGA